MHNELVLLGNILIISGATLIAFRLGAEALISFVAFSMVLANLFVIKQTTFFGFNATTADALTVGSMIGLNLLQEFFGKKAAKAAISTTFFLLILYAVASQIHLLYIPSSIDISQDNFTAILSFAPALVFGSFCVYLFAQIMDFLIYGALKRLWNNNAMVLRNYIALGLSHLADTILFTLWLLFLGIIKNPVHIVIVSFSVKFIIILIITPIIGMAAKKLHTEYHLS